MTTPVVLTADQVGTLASLLLDAATVETNVLCQDGISPMVLLGTVEPELVEAFYENLRTAAPSVLPADVCELLDPSLAEEAHHQNGPSASTSIWWPALSCSET
jgi:hypothetical protein